MVLSAIMMVVLVLHVDLEARGKILDLYTTQAIKVLWSMEETMVVEIIVVRMM